MFSEKPEIGPLESLTVKLPEGTTSGIENEPKVTIVISAFQPDQHIFTAVKSALAQTYRNLEIMVIDDASGAAYKNILARVAALDERIRVLVQPVNGGTYRIRNRALDEATGDLITFQDSDDWMHPQRIEVQVKHLLANPNQVGNTTMSTRLTDRLEAAESNRRLRVGICEPSLMFWRVRVRDQIGYFDGVRKGGDTEFRKRMDRAFKVDSAMVYPWRILTIQRADNGGLTQGELGFRWITEFRLNYRDLYLNWHKTTSKLYIPRDDASASLADQEASRAFYAPRQTRMIAREARSGNRRFDLLIAANLKDPKNVKAAVARVEQALRDGKTVALTQINALYPRELGRVLRKEILELLNQKKVEMVYWRDEVKVERLEFLAPNAWITSHDGTQAAWAIKDFFAVDHESAEESFVAAGAKVAPTIKAAFKTSFSK
jgi:glycosyltransferase involved in cell wall biosynthesis